MDLKAVHFAPEKGVARSLWERFGSGYRAFDYEPSRYPLGFIEVEKIDLCERIDSIPVSSQDVVLHNHVLEHLPCNPWRVLQNLDSLLKPGGVHVFTLPVISDYYREDMDPRLSPEERVARFGQNDHIRMFGRHDLRKMLTEEFGADVHFSSSVRISEEDLIRAGVPIATLHGVNSHTVFVHVRE